MRRRNETGHRTEESPDPGRVAPGGRVPVLLGLFIVGCAAEFDARGAPGAAALCIDGARGSARRRAAWIARSLETIPAGIPPLAQAAQTRRSPGSRHRGSDAA